MGANQPIRVLSADAPKTGLRRCCDVFAADTGHAVEIELLTAPRIRDRVIAGAAAADVVVVPQPVLEKLAAAGRIEAASIGPVGSVLVGVVVRDGAREPDLGSVATFTKAVLAADAIVYNTASSGLYVAELMARLGLASKIADKTVVVQTGGGLMAHMAGDPRDAIGFCHVTEIRLHEGRGTHLVGVLPDPIGRITTYAAGAVAAGASVEYARALIDFLTSVDGKRLFVDAGVL